MDELEIVVLGCGSIGTALLQGLLKKGNPRYTYVAHVNTALSAERIESELESEARQRVVITYGQDKIVHAVANADVVLLGVQPQTLPKLLDSQGLVDTLQDKTIISMLAGVSVSQILDMLVAKSTSTGRANREAFTVARIIPTLGATRGNSVTLLAEPSESDTADRFRRVEKILSQCGSVIRVEESVMNSATAIGAVVHALAIVAVDSVTDASVAAGVPRSVAAAIASQSLNSASGLLSGKDRMLPEHLKAAMSTPGGITLNAVVDLDDSARSGIAAAVKAAVKYANRMND
ncbi:pyrroline-5-carboxylate reductase [Viridothelium virens]|uniref:Pyrroline-5-carboxylate reductase n=1 Tax=Viridothelium virens TaxID=1048519 RepID=A0A6A6GYC5_VIRVR|nr:pyrroline-5-carboxylate reductase [Viridothelium virens]